LNARSPIEPNFIKRKTKKVIPDWEAHQEPGIASCVAQGPDFQSTATEIDGPSSGYILIKRLDSLS